MKFYKRFNSNMLQGVGHTAFGRYVKFTIFPFSFEEYAGITGKEMNRSAYLEYMESGGLPSCSICLRGDKKKLCLGREGFGFAAGYYSASQNKRSQAFGRHIIYLVNNASNLFSVNNLANYFKTGNSGPHTIPYPICRVHRGCMAGA